MWFLDSYGESKSSETSVMRKIFLVTHTDTFSKTNWWTPIKCVHIPQLPASVHFTLFFFIQNKLSLFLHERGFFRYLDFKLLVCVTRESSRVNSHVCKCCSEHNLKGFEEHKSLLYTLLPRITLSLSSLHRLISPLRQQSIVHCMRESHKNEQKWKWTKIQMTEKCCYCWWRNQISF